MNILFLMKTYEVGGQEVVTSVLAKCFADHGHRAVIASFKEPNPMMRKRTDSRIKFYTIGKFACTNENVDKVRGILADENIDLVINQWGLPYVPCKVLDKAKEGLNIKTIAVYHNSPDENARVKSVEIAIEKTKSFYKKQMLQVEKWIFKYITSRSMRYVYNHSDLYLVLSPSFINKFKRFTGIKNPVKLMVQTNPVTLCSEGYIYDKALKQKEILYVGRIDYNQKRVCRVIDTWALLEKEFPDWRLTIVGDGVERENVEKQSKELGLQRVSFEGFQNPTDYYKRASMLILTSEFEGFPLVLAEAMTFGVIPAVYNSYSAVGDIIDDKKDGIVIPYHKSGYNAAEAAALMAKVMEDDALRHEMALAALDKSKLYSLDTIYRQWEEKMSGLLKLSGGDAR